MGQSPQQTTTHAWATPVGEQYTLTTAAAGQQPTRPRVLRAVV